MGRVYKINMTSVSIGTAVQDIIAVKAGLGGLKLHAIHIGSPTTAVMRVRLKRSTATLTLGSVGTAGTLVQLDGGDSAPTATARLNDTTQATTSGAFTTVWEDYFVPTLPFDYLPPPEHREVCVLNGGFVFDMPAVSAAAVTVAGYMVVEEMPG